MEGWWGERRVGPWGLWGPHFLPSEVGALEDSEQRRNRSQETREKLTILFQASSGLG